MRLKSMIKLKYRSIRHCAMVCDIPYATVYNLCEGRTDIYQCSCATAKRLADGLGMTVDELLKGESFALFRNDLHNQYKARGPMKFLLKHLTEDTVSRLWEQKKTVHALYLLAMIDLVSRNNDLPLADEYKEIRQYKLERPVYVGDSVMDRKKAKENALPEFAAYNIYEGTIDDAV